jgi:hypothetical protein
MGQDGGLENPEVVVLKAAVLPVGPKTLRFDEREQVRGVQPVLLRVLLGHRLPFSRPVVSLRGHTIPFDGIVKRPSLSEHTLGQVMQLLMLATVVEGRLMGVNPYGQPGSAVYQHHQRAALKAMPNPAG